MGEIKIQSHIAEEITKYQVSQIIFIKVNRAFLKFFSHITRRMWNKDLIEEILREQPELIMSKLSSNGSLSFQRRLFLV